MSGLDLNLLPDGGVSWLDASGPDAHIVLSTRIRLARNLADARFTPRATDPERERIFDRVLEAGRAAAAMADATVFRVDQLSRLERQLLHERHLISKELAGLEDRTGVRHGAALLTNGAMGVMINEEDHLRLQVLHSGFAPGPAYQSMARFDRDLGTRVPFAFHQEFGYLTSCPTNAGTGLRASVLIHLPGLVLTKEIAKVLQGLTQVGLTFRGSEVRQRAAYALGEVARAARN